MDVMMPNRPDHACQRRSSRYRAWQRLRDAICICALLWPPMTAWADRVLDHPELQTGLERLQQDRPADAALIWSDLANSATDQADVDLALSGVLATIAWEQVGDPRAYEAWAKAIAGFLQAGTSWENEREKMKSRLDRNNAALQRVDPDNPPILIAEDQWLQSVNQLTQLSDYQGPATGLTAALPQNDSTVSVNYFGTTPQNNAATDSRQSSDMVTDSIDQDKTDDDAILNNNRSTASRALAYIGQSSDQASNSLNTNRTDADASHTVATTNTTSVNNDDESTRLASGPIGLGPDQADIASAAIAIAPRPILQSPDLMQSETDDEGQLDGKQRTALSVATALQNIQPFQVRSLPDKPKSKSNVVSQPILDKSLNTTINTDGLKAIGTTAIDLDSATQQAMAQTAWAYFEANRQPQTGMFNSKQGYAFATPWEMGHMLAGLVSAQQLGLIDRDRFLDETATLLSTLADLPLYNQSLPNREYSTRTGQMIDMNNQISQTGSGWSAIGLGRLMLWLALTARYYPELDAAAHAVSSNWNISSLVDQGRFVGMIRRGATEQTFQEGRLGYEQYAAAGFALQGINLANAMTYDTIGTRQIDRVLVWLDQRPNSRTTSEPLYLGLMELGGIDGCFRQVADSHLKAQLSHAVLSKTPTAMSEEFLPAAPWFVLSSVYANGQAWNTASHDGQPRPDLQTYSLKSALAWYAIAPRSFDQWPNNIVEQLSSPNGYRAGIMNSGKSNTALSLATNAVILESLWYINRERQPFMVFNDSPVAGCPIGAPNLDVTPAKSSP